jgi:ABC-2 type transport system permease protein
MLPAGVVRNARASYAFFERNMNLTKRYWAWEAVWLVYNIVNAVSVTYIGASAQLITGVTIDWNGGLELPERGFRSGDGDDYD